MPEFFSAFITLLQESVDLIDPLFRMQPAHQSLEQMACMAIDNGYEYMAITDTDTTYYPPNAIQRLMAHDKDVVFAHSFNRGYPFNPAPMVKKPGKNPDGRKPFGWDEVEFVWPNQGLQKVWVGSFQLVLIKTRVLKKLHPWMFQYNPIAGVDWYFYQLCEDNGFEVWCDTDLQVDHHNINRRTFSIYKNLYTELQTQHVEMVSM